jgi:hypothetical protein
MWTINNNRELKLIAMYTKRALIYKSIFPNTAMYKKVQIQVKPNVSQTANIKFDQRLVFDSLSQSFLIWFLYLFHFYHN